MPPPTLKHISDDRIDRWLGAERSNALRENFRDWYGPPVCVRDLPGSVWIAGGGNFVGEFARGGFYSAFDALKEYLSRVMQVGLRPSYGVMGVGFTSISDALARASGGDGQLLNGGMINKVGTTGVSSGANSLWGVGTMSAAGAAASAAPGGRVPTSATTGALAYTNPGSGTMHLTGADFLAGISNNGVMLYDRIFDVAKTMNSTATEAVTGVPSRYQSTTPAAADSAEGNFLFIEVQTALAATAHNWTVCQYTDQAGTTGISLPSVTGNSGAIINRFDMPTGSWFCPLASDDTGVKALTQMQCSAAVATGAINFVIGHPIGVMAFPSNVLPLPFDWLTNRFQAPRIFDSACLALLELPKPSTTACTYNGLIYLTRAAP